jgi:arabinofuranan 3-O-arabinosyltransferase
MAHGHFPVPPPAVPANEQPAPMSSVPPPSTLAVPTEQSPSLAIGTWGSTSRSAAIGAGEDSLFVVNEMFNRGWRAALDGVQLEPLIIDGWRQAFIVPAGSGGTIELTFSPTHAYQAGIAVGMVLLILLTLLAVVPRRRFRRFAPLGSGTWFSPLVVVAGVITAIGTTGIGAIALPILWALRRRIVVFLPTIAFLSYCPTGWYAGTVGTQGWGE